VPKIFSARFFRPETFFAEKISVRKFLRAVLFGPKIFGENILRPRNFQAFFFFAGKLPVLTQVRGRERNSPGKKRSGRPKKTLVPNLKNEHVKNPMPGGISLI